MTGGGGRLFLSVSDGDFCALYRTDRQCGIVLMRVIVGILLTFLPAGEPNGWNVVDYGACVCVFFYNQPQNQLITQKRCLYCVWMGLSAACNELRRKRDDQPITASSCSCIFFCCFGIKRYFEGPRLSVVL